MAADDEAGEQELLLPLLTLEDVQQGLQKFLERNPSSSVSILEIPDVGQIQTIASPWGDPTLQFLLPPDPKETFEVLNSIYLPERLSAVWHEDTKDLEVVWTALPLAKGQQEIEGRKFKFLFGGKTYSCEFGDSSERLKQIASWTAPRTNPSATQFRNMLSFARMAHQERNESDTTDYKARSFWIRKVKLDDAAAIRMIECLNFFLSYYDHQSPRVLVHDIHEPVANKCRYKDGGFPNKISGRAFDGNLMSFWEATRQANTMLRFIFYYRIIEYASSHYVDAAIRAKLAKVVANPTIGERVDQAIEDIIAAFDGSKVDEVPRFNALITATVNPDIVWREIETNKDIFAKKLVFDGGFTLNPLVSKDETAKTFHASGLVKFADSIRRIRNVLVHGRDQSTATAITPTPRNMKFLAAWENAIAAAAGEVVLYGSNA